MYITKIPRSPYWHVRFPDPAGTGRTIQKSTGETRERDARKRGAELEEAHRAAWQLTHRGGDITALGLSMQFWESELSRRKSSQSAELHLHRIVIHLGKEKPYCEVTTADVARFRDAMDAQGEFSVSTINRHIETWRRMHNHARDIREYPVKTVKWTEVLRDEPAGRTRVLSEDELRAVLENLPIEAQEIVAFGLYTGARKAQVLGLAWDRVDLKNHTAKIYLKSRKQYVLHTIPLSKGARAILRRRSRVSSEGLVFDTKNFRKLWEAALRRAGIKDFRFHDLRHTFASVAAGKMPLPYVQSLLGHAQITTTQRYSHVQGGALQEAVDALPEIPLFEKE